VYAWGQALHVAYDTDGTITINGKRTLIIGSYYASNKYTEPKPKEADYRALAKAGFNLVHGSADQLDMIHDAGLMAWVTVGTVDLKDIDGSAKKLRQKVEAVRDKPAVAFLETVDEPAWTWMKAEQRVPAEALVKAYPVIKDVDSNHLLYTNHAPTNLVSTLKTYNPGTDIVACDIYPVNPGGLKHSYALFEDGQQGDLNNQTISQVGEYTRKMRRVAGPDRPVFMVLQAFAWEMFADPMERREEKILYPTYNESRFMAYDALINGSNGILYWGSFFTPQPSDCWTGIKRVTRELADLSGALAERDAKLPLKLTYHEMGHSGDDGIEWIAKMHQGKLYLFTCNAYRYPCRVTFSGLKGWTSCEVLNEKRDAAMLPVKDGAFTDTWKRFDVHVYQLSR